ncbi:MAG: hypothetical protein U1D30_21045 [Planctomycetota bacterium]
MKSTAPFYKPREVRRTARTSGGLSFLTLAILVSFTSRASACPFCARMGKTLLDEVREAEVVVDGRLEDAKPDALGQPGSTKLVPLSVIKSPGRVASQQSFTLDRYLPSTGTRGRRRLVFGQWLEGFVDPYRTIVVENDLLTNYLADSLARADREAGDKYAFFFQYLEHADPTLAEDAYKEFAKATYADVAKGAKGYDADKLRAWLSEEATPSYRIGLYGLLLGLCGKEVDRMFLHDLLEKPSDRLLYGIDGVLAGYCLLDAKGGPDKVMDLLADANQPFKLRYSAMSATRFLLTDFPDADRDRLLGRLLDAVQVVDTADIVIDELRRQGHAAAWKKLEPLGREKAYANTVIQRSLLRFALSFPDIDAKPFLENIEAQHPGWVAEERQNLEFERDVARQFSAPGER